MRAPRRNNLLVSRRRTDDDGEDEGSVAGGIDDDSSSQASAISDADNDADADGESSGYSDVGIPNKTGNEGNEEQESRKESNGKVVEPIAAAKMPSFSASMADTEAMMNGMKIVDNGTNADEIDFDNAEERPEAVPVQPAENQGPSASDRTETLGERRRREHEEYKKKRDEDPAFVPNRGGFFMHDHRTTAPGQNGFRPSGRGRGGRGRGGIGAPFPSVSHAQVTPNPADSPWAHDLHESVTDSEPHKTDAPKPTPGLQVSQQQKLPLPAIQNPPPNRSFSRTTRVGNVQLRVFIAGMKDAIFFSAVPVNQHTRLPHHRPPLRRDKPVRISLPDYPPRYIFPAMDRSFIFIPRALRPNQQGFGRGRGRGSIGGFSGFPSGRTSVYGGSVYSPSVTMSRRSSLAREVGREGMASPAGSVMSRNRSVIMEAGKPVVRLPPAADPAFIQAHPQQQQYSNSPVPVVNLPQQQYPLPQKPLSQNWSSLPMHQPRPQKQLSVADIESPTTLNFHPPQQQQQQPFHHQVPAAVNGQTYPVDSSMLPRSRRPSHPSQRGTPLSQIPERAIHAQPFNPYQYQPAPAFYPQQYPTPIYYYPPPTSAMDPQSVAAPNFMPGQPYSFVVPTAQPPAPTEPTTQAGMVAHESNGMVYYYDSSQLAVSAEDTSSFQQHVAFAPPSGFMIPQPAVFYPPQ